MGGGRASLPPATPIREGAVDDITLTEITITRKIREDGQQVFSVGMEREFSFVEALGLLEAAKWDICQRMAGRP